MNPEDRETICNILFQCGSTISDGILFEMTFTKGFHEGIKAEMEVLKQKLVTLYLSTLELMATVKYHVSKIQPEQSKENGSRLSKWNAWWSVRGLSCPSILSCLFYGILN